MRKFRSHATRPAAAAAVVAACLVVWAGPAFADSPNPIPSTVHADMTENGNGTVTVSVHGEWNWVSHHSDCNLNRNGAGIASLEDRMDDLRAVMDAAGLLALRCSGSPRADPWPSSSPPPNRPNPASSKSRCGQWSKR